MNGLENVSLVEQVEIVKGLLYVYIPIVILTLSNSLLLLMEELVL